MSAVAHIDEYKTGRFFSDAFRGEMSWNGYENNSLLRNEGCSRPASDAVSRPEFIDLGLALGADDQRDARGVALADFDQDGDLDLAINHNPGDNDDAKRGDAVLLRNDLGSHRSWLVVELEGTVSNRDAVGARVRIEAGGVTPMREVTAGSGYASQHSPRLSFGLGDAERVERLTIQWPSGRRDDFVDLPVRRRIRVVEGNPPEVPAASPGTDR